MEDVGVVVRVRVVVEAVEQLRVVLAPAQQGVIHAVVDTPLDPLHVARFAGSHDSDAVAGMGRQQVTYPLGTKVGRREDHTVLVQLIATDLALEHEAQQGILHRRVGLTILVDHQDDRLLVMRTQLLVGGIADEGSVRASLGDARQGDVTQVLGRAVEVARRVGRHGSRQGAKE